MKVLAGRGLLQVAACTVSPAAPAMVLAALAVTALGCRQAPDVDVNPDVGDSAVDDGTAHDGPAEAIGPRPPLFGDCVPGEHRCSPSPSRKYIDTCDYQGRWVPLVDCDLSRVVPSWRFSCFDCDPTLFCGVAIVDPEYEACSAAGASSVAGPHSACSPAGDQVLVSVGFAPRCPRSPDAPAWLFACRNDDPQGTLPDGLDVQYEITCACASDVFRIAEIEAMPGASRPSWYPIAYGACTDSGIGRPDLWADDVVRANLDAVWPHMAGWNGVCEEPGTFDFNGWCLPIGVGYCNRDEDCLDGQRCELEPAPGYNHCVPR